MMNRLILLRHGITEANRLHRYCGSTDLPLDPQALAEFRATRAGLVYPDPAGFRILTSGMARTEETLLELYGPLPHGVERDFREIDFGAFENKTYEELKDDPAYQAWLTGDNEKNVCPGGESGAQMTARVLAALNRLEADTLLVTHGGVIAAIMAHLFPAQNRNRYQWQPRPFYGYAITWTADGAEYQEIPARPAAGGCGQN